MNQIIERLKNDIAKKSFNETIELCIKTNIEGKRTDQTIKGAITLPHKTGIEYSVAAFTEDNNAKADKIGLENLVDEIKQGKVKKYDRYVATPSVMSYVTPLGAQLKKRMPNKNYHSIGDNIHEVIERAKYDIHFQSDDKGSVKIPVAKIEMQDSEIQENILHVIKHINQSFKDVKNKIIQAHISTTQGKGSLDITEYCINTA